MIVLLMGVSGSGKTTIGTLLAGRLDTVFADADDFHSPANKAKMAAGHALTDDDRQPWLATLNQLLRGWADAGQSGVLACSALKASYRDTLAADLPAGTIRIVFLDGAPTLIAQRLAARHHEYMSPALLTSQLLTLDPPTGALRFVNDRTPAQVVDEILVALSNPPAEP